TAEEMLLGPDLRPARDWRPCANIASTRAVCAGDTRLRRLLRGPASPARSPLVRRCLASGRSSRLFRPLLVQMRLRTLFVVQICRGRREGALDRFQVVRIPKTVAGGVIYPAKVPTTRYRAITFVTPPINGSTGIPAVPLRPPDEWGRPSLHSAQSPTPWR